MHHFVAHEVLNNEGGKSENVVIGGQSFRSDSMSLLFGFFYFCMLRLSSEYLCPPMH